jgi:hypothetical protein
MVSVRYEFGITVRSNSIRDLLDQIEPVSSKSHPVLYPGLLRVPNVDKILGKFRDCGEDKVRLLPIVIKTEGFSGIRERVRNIADILMRFYE